MKIRTISLHEAMAWAEGYPFVYLRMLSSVSMGNTSEILPRICWEEVEEARFFGPSGELRVFDDGAALTAAVLEDGPHETEYSVQDRTCPLAHDGAFGREIVVRDYLDYDGDGQLFVSASRLKDWR